MADVADAHDLYRLPPEEFTAARDALVRKLRADKERDRADEVKKLRRPSPIAWALNQVARDDTRLIESVLDAGQEVKDALDRGDGEAIRDAERSMRGASDAVVDAASHVMDGTGHLVTDDARARMAATLRASLMDSEVADRVRAGTLDRDVELAGLGLGDIAVAGSRATRSASRRPARAAADDEQPEHDDKQAENEQRRQAKEARRAARVRVAELQSQAERLASRAQRLAGVADRAEEAARGAKAEADEAQSEAVEAAERLSAARAALDSEERSG